MARLDAYRYEHRLAFCHMEHAYLSWRLEHNYRALLLYTSLGYRPVDWTWAWSRHLDEGER